MNRKSRKAAVQRDKNAPCKHSKTLCIGDNYLSQRNSFKYRNKNISFPLIHRGQTRHYTCIRRHSCLHLRFTVSRKKIFKLVGQVLPNCPALDPSHMNPITDIPTHPESPGEIQACMGEQGALKKFKHKKQQGQMTHEECRDTD